MLQRKTIKLCTDLSTLIINKIDWDVVIYGKPWQVVQIEDYYHTEGGKYGKNNYWCHPLDENIRVDNLIRFNGEPVCWGFRFAESHYCKVKYDDSEMRCGSSGMITRNGKDFYEVSGRDMSYVMAKAQVLIVQLNETLPIVFSYRNWKEQMIGRTIKRNNRLYKISSIIEDQGCFIADNLYVNGQVIDTPENAPYIKCEYLDPAVEWYIFKGCE